MNFTSAPTSIYYKKRLSEAKKRNIEQHVWLYAFGNLKTWYQFEDKPVRPKLHCLMVMDVDCDDIISMYEGQSKLDIHFGDTKLLKHEISVENASGIFASSFLIDCMTVSTIGHSSAGYLPRVVICMQTELVETLNKELSQLDITVIPAAWTGVPFGEFYDRKTMKLQRPDVFVQTMENAEMTLSQYGKNEEKGLFGQLMQAIPTNIEDYASLCNTTLMMTYCFFDASMNMFNLKPWRYFRTKDLFEVKIYVDGNQLEHSVPSSLQHFFTVSSGGLQAYDMLRDYCLKRWEVIITDDNDSDTPGFKVEELSRLKNIPNRLLEFSASSSLSFADDDAWTLACSRCPNNKENPFPKPTPMEWTNTLWLTLCAYILNEFVRNKKGLALVSPADVDEGKCTFDFILPEITINQCKPVLDCILAESLTEEGTFDTHKVNYSVNVSWHGLQYSPNMEEIEEENEEKEDEFFDFDISLNDELIEKIDSDEEFTDCSPVLPCNFCESDSPSFFCAGCHVVKYCNTKCQKKDWKQHKSVCKKCR